MDEREKILTTRDDAKLTVKKKGLLTNKIYNKLNQKKEAMKEFRVQNSKSYSSNPYATHQNSLYPKSSNYNHGTSQPNFSIFGGRSQPRPKFLPRSMNINQLYNNPPNLMSDQFINQGPNYGLYGYSNNFQY